VRFREPDAGEGSERHVEKASLLCVCWLFVSVTWSSHRKQDLPCMPTPAQLAGEAHESRWAVSACACTTSNPRANPSYPAELMQIKQKDKQEDKFTRPLAKAKQLTVAGRSSVRVCVDRHSHMCQSPCLRLWCVHSTQTALSLARFIFFKPRACYVATPQFWAAVRRWIA
jgi:hypothetical protein